MIIIIGIIVAIIILLCYLLLIAKEIVNKATYIYT